ncbi:MAG TPA: 4-(cytidine 5'-diphospho)-2-C-methyl-D-erythritol kinase [Flavobacteriales bacterium]|nr:MAG: 4-(cytidine 5'-diphospho)-2-C-methyl-D-erythritol kinase [Flavobacteriales bacterium]HQV38828.1 4-(cytidine 5'-diphospho)-2-C-methyl-D-erythritol kinase [Flavobacteriales bacterium]HQW31388.1 4-(cytidine 5'-diphospho)-2-C-methyl-D-erythritol kinase [Flavobacteriales bacterium]HQY01412.1 4-(cytidine 5'-diphospho)-2-C-methyl-D-erythritol kinase [Flavobacteriales bacterium]HQY80288.1 4-(cytidine 5'-diphospho)-2-C-methyl-D-erythritol kinase [Flavobacteriales bacterium]
MLVFPFAKINLGLQVLRKRPDGFHDIRTVMVPIPLCDALEAVVDEGAAPGEVRFERTGIPVPGDASGDLCMKAVEQVRKFRELPGLRIHLHKAVPMGAGLGGGSSDAAHTLLLLNALLDLGLAPKELHAMAATLGSDCPFFLQQGAQLADGRGEVLSPLHVDLTGHWLVLVNPSIHVPTAEVYGNMRLAEHHDDLPRMIAAPIASWQGTVVNDMEEYVFAKYPAIKAIKQELLARGASYAAMSGSGSSVFGVFSRKPMDLVFPEGYSMWVFPGRAES